jgi:Flp pilus assembly pilin Flp
MNKALSNIKHSMLELWHDDRGAEGLEKLLIIAAVALPLLAVLLFFSGSIKEWVQRNWGEVTDNPGADPGAGDFPL